MQQLPDRIDPASLGRLQLRMRGVLRKAGVDHQALQGQACSDAGCHQSLQGRAEPRQHPRLRQAEAGETPLSIEEIEIGRATRVFK